MLGGKETRLQLHLLHRMEFTAALTPVEIPAVPDNLAQSKRRATEKRCTQATIWKEDRKAAIKPHGIALLARCWAEGRPNVFRPEARQKASGRGTAVVVLTFLAARMTSFWRVGLRFFRMNFNVYLFAFITDLFLGVHKLFLMCFGTLVYHC